MDFFHLANSHFINEDFPEAVEVRPTCFLLLQFQILIYKYFSLVGLHIFFGPKPT
jgi:hypothetical protein